MYYKDVNDSYELKDLISCCERNKHLFQISNGKISDDYTQTWFALLLIGLSSGGYFIYYMNNTAYGIYCIIGSLFLYKIFGRSRIRSLNDLSKRIYEKLLSLKYNIYHSEKITSDYLVNKYSLFPRGDRDYGIEYCYKNKLSGLKNYHIKYFYESKTESSDSKGRTTSTYSKKYLYAILIPKKSFPVISFEKSKRKNKNIWSPTSPDFNKHYKINNGDELELAKFFTPSVAEDFVINLKSLPSDFKLETKNKYICITYNDPKLTINEAPQVSIRKYDAFMKSLIDSHFHEYEALLSNLSDLLKIKEDNYG